MDSLNYKINKHVLLTGSGFTKNFGGFLANELWSWIFNYPEIGKYPQLSNLLKNDFDYESIYYKVIEGSEFNDYEKKAITEAIYNGYKNLDNKIKGYRSLGEKQPVGISDVSEFIERFSGYSKYTKREDTKGFFFTLNQDLFIERYCSPPNFKPITLYVPQRKLSQDEEYEEMSHSVSLPSVADIEKANPLSSSKFFYVKLHGSWSWYSSDVDKKLVIGKNKLKQISDEPVLKEYLKLFEQTLSTPEVRLFVIGYGFGDEHINKIIADSINNNNLKLYVLNPSNPESFKTALCADKSHGGTIFNGLAGYYPYSLSQVFPGSNTVEYQHIQDNYFI